MNAPDVLADPELALLLLALFLLTASMLGGMMRTFFIASVAMKWARIALPIVAFSGMTGWRLL